MGFRAIYKGLEVICDTIADLDLLAEHANGTKPRRVPVPPESRVPITNDKQQGDEPLWLFIKTLPEKTIEVLSALMANGTMTDEQLRKALSLDNNMQLAGRVAPVSRNAKKYGIEPESVLRTKMISNKPGARKYQYDVVEAATSYIRRRIRGRVD